MLKNNDNLLSPFNISFLFYDMEKAPRISAKCLITYLILHKNGNCPKTSPVKKQTGFLITMI